MKWLLALLSAALILIGLHYAVAIKSALEVARERERPFLPILKERRIDDHHLSVDGLREIDYFAWPLTRSTFEQKHGALKTFAIEPPDNWADVYEYIIYLSQDGKTYWIYRQGGITGVSEYWGPGTVKTDDED